ncbi:OsmC family protein [Microbacterium sp. MTN4-26]|uniref:OsmC family protein n=1 Tax=unclassified Microbacterium TaxID=2609290 RepID=UPI0036F2D3D8
MDAIYTAEALATGEGRAGAVRTRDGHVDMDLRIPREMGGPGGGANPEALFAAGYAACFHSALQAAARAQKVTLEDTSVGSRFDEPPRYRWRATVSTAITCLGTLDSVAAHLAKESPCSSVARTTASPSRSSSR